AIAGRVTLPVTLAVDGACEVRMDVQLYGPGDVTGLDPRQIVRTDPRAGAASSEDSYLASVDFARADLPWLFTPATASAGGRLRPWLCLVVVGRGDGIVLDPNAGGPLPVLEIGSPARPTDELPDLAQSWAWAHAQIAGSTDGQDLGEILLDSPARASSRLLCPRRLQPDTAYLACLVPAFALGVTAGLGLAPQAADETQLAPAWTLDGAAAQVRLPVYYSWEFSTGPAGDFESLVRRIRPRALPPEASHPSQLDLSQGGGGLPQLDPATPGVVVGLESVMRLPGPDAPPPWADDGRVPFQQALERVLDTASAETLTPPVYGAVQAGVSKLPADRAEPEWLRELNLDPRLRVAAAAGTRVVQDRQEELMASAWEQAGTVRQANTLLRQAQLARELGGVLYERHLQPLAPAELLAVTGPAHAQIAMSPQTLADELRGSRLPDASVSGAFRRLASPQGALLRRAVPSDEQRGPLDVLPALDRLAVAPAPPPPTGMVALADAALPAPVAHARPAFAPESVQALLLDRLRPDVTVVARAQTLVDAPDGTWQRTDPLAPLTPAPEFPQPMYDGLRDVAPDLLLPGVEHVPADSVGLLETTPRLIEAYMVGLNHEMSRELLWREFPTDLRGTWFRHFWDVSGQPGDPEALKDIPPLREWDKAPLGQHLRGPNGGGQLVLLVRGELLRRYPTTNVYAAPAGADGQPDTATRLVPMFRGSLDPDITFLGFALSQEAALGTDPAGPGWYFVFEQHPGEPRFGFDEEAGTATPTTPDDLAWSHVPLTASGYVDVSKPLLAGSDDLQAAWGRDAASIVRLTLQKPVRVAVHATAILVVEEGG
ncbi:MAG TPA: hypothetical protein VLN26_14875, partial [Gaiellaceae bacterium]|nr:hypothetical protein [Gaiellaceae bacterium]